MPIINAEVINGVLVKFKPAPETRASILVAIPRLIRHFNPMQQISFFRFSKASKINLSPKIKNIAKTIHLLKGATKS